MKNQKLTVNPDQFSAKAREVWNMLDERQKEAIQKNYVLRPARNHEIILLKKNGVDIGTLIEITGLERSQICRITRGVKPGSAYVKEVGSGADMNTLTQLIEDLVEHTRQINESMATFNQILIEAARNFSSEPWPPGGWS